MRKTHHTALPLLYICLLLGASISIASAKDKLNIQTDEEPYNLNPFANFQESSAPILSMIFDPLLQVIRVGHKHVKYESRIITEWEANSDSTEWIFRMRRDAFWPDRDRVTAHDAVFTIQAIINQREETPYRYFFSGIPEDAVKALDDYTFRVELPKKDPGFRRHMSVYLQKKEEYDGKFPNIIDGKAYKYPPGTGVFQNDPEQDRDKVTSHINLVRNSRYFLDPPQNEDLPQQVSFYCFGGDPGRHKINRFLMRGEGLDIIPLLNPVEERKLLSYAPDYGMRLERDYSLLRVPLRKYYAIAINCKEIPKHVRQAMALGFDKTGCIEKVYGPYVQGTILEGPIIDPAIKVGSLENSAQSQSRFEPDNARKLLGGAKYRYSILYSQNRDDSRDVASFFRENMEDIGITIDLEGHAPEIVKKGIRSKSFRLALAERKLDPSGYPIYRSHYTRGKNNINFEGFNYVLFHTNEVDSLFIELEEAKAKKNTEKQLGLLHELNVRISDECPYLYLFLPDYWTAYKRSLRNYRLVLPSYYLNSYEWYYDTR